jgi:hypothetical protein
LSDRENFSELCWLIEKFFAQKIQWNKKSIRLSCWIWRHGWFLEGVYEIELDTKTEYEEF